MTKPSLMTIVSDWQMTRFNADTGAPYLIPSLNVMREDIKYSLKHHDIVRLSRLANYVADILTDGDIQIIKDFGKECTDYHMFSETPLFQRLEKIRAKQLTLQNIFDDAIVAKVAEEITVAVMCGFEQEIRDYKLQGIAAYPDITMSPICPILAYDHPTTTYQYEVNAIKVMRQVPSLKMEQVMLSHLKHRHPDPENCKFADVKHHLIDKVSMARNELAEKVDMPMHYLKVYFSLCLARYDDLESLKICIEYIIAYQNNGGGTNLSAVLNYDERDEGNINLFLLYQQHGKNLLQIPDIMECLPSVMTLFDPTKGRSMSFESQRSMLYILDQLNILQDHFNILPGILSQRVGDTTQLVKIFERDLALFANLIKMPWTQLKWILYSKFDDEYEVLHNMLMYHDRVALFNVIVQNCNLHSLVKIANLIFEGASERRIKICDELDSAEFSKIILTRLQAESRLSEVSDIIKYCLCVFNIDKEFAIIYALQVGKIGEFLDEYITEPGQDSLFKVCKIGEYIFSPQGADLIRSVIDVVDDATFFEFEQYGTKFVIGEDVVVKGVDKNVGVVAVVGDTLGEDSVYEEFFV